jgi:hypothetical protein
MSVSFVEALKARNELDWFERSISPLQVSEIPFVTIQGRCLWLIHFALSVNTSIFQRQLNRESTSTTGRAFDCELPLVSFDNPTGDGQTQSRAAQGA